MTPSSGSLFHPAVLSGGPCRLLRLAHFSGRQPYHDTSSRACTSRADFEAAAQLAYPFPHSSNAYSDRAAGFLPADRLDIAITLAPTP